MDKIFRKITLLPVLVGLIILSLVLFENSDLQLKPQTQQKSVKGAEKVQIDSFTYKGKLGKNALELLKEKAKVEQDKSGLVVSINNKVADLNKKEFWSFYVNGKQASVGPEQYQTKDSDVIEWKIEKF